MSFFQETIKVPRAVLIKTAVLIPILILFIVWGHTLEKSDAVLSIPNIEVKKEHLRLNPNEGRWYHEQKPFNGYSVVYYENGKIAERIGFVNGKRQGPAFKWYENGNISSEKHYLNNRLEGITKTWWPNGKQSTESNYLNRKRHGEQLKWYPTGQLARRNQFVNGREEGLQQAWLQTGKLYANYEAKNGRFFGLKRSNLCYQLKDEVVQK